jgi:hypothetical protein
VQLLKSGKVPAGKQDAVLGQIALLGGPNELRLVFDLAMAGDTPVARRAALLSTLVDASRTRKVKPAGDLAGVGRLFVTPDPTVRSLALRAAGAWQLEALRPQLASTASTEGTPADLRIAAVHGLASLGGEASRNALVQLTARNHPQALRLQAVIALRNLDMSLAAKQAVQVFADHKPGDDVIPVFQSFFEQKTGPEALLVALKDQKLPEDVAKLGVRAARTAGRDLQPIIDRLSAAGGLTGTARVLSPEQMQELVAAVKDKGNAARGEALFRPDQPGSECPD